MALTTAAEVKAYWNYSGTDRDTWLAAMIPVAQDLVEKLCGRPASGFDSATYTEDIDGRGGPLLTPKCWPITSITSVSWRASDGTLTALDSSTYWISADARSIERSGSNVVRGLGNPNSLSDDAFPRLTAHYPQFVEGNKNYRVIYVGGYSSIPSSLKAATWRILDQMWAVRGQSPDLIGEKIGNYSYTLAEASALGDQDDPMSLASLLSNWTVQL